MIDKIESYTLNINHLDRRAERRRLSKLLENITFQAPVQYQFIKLKQCYFLRIHLPKQVLPYFVGLLSAFITFLFINLFLHKRHTL
ncbi:MULTISPECIES: hypothetical protein [unclassified Staphylococcus]|uniref:hypothetical protein n=1 Tax=unclassified Staphylococcus TaxID=91994 RepID=UPI0021D38F0C|nr:MULTISPECIES: hypothetical protein [unclassified Staphylococcus]UXR75977.1 hypothetical protein MUA74_10015 [Staphylococcus sp. IVB6233]UXR80174.1 hypothetical protein MUA65_09620 [Staphylococcus sp. IVB6218]